MRLLALFLTLQCVLFGQRVLYDRDLDKKGQDAAAAAKNLASERLTANEFENLAAIEKDQIDGALESAVLIARRYVETLSTWGSVQRSANQICGLILDDPLREWDVTKVELILRRTPSGDTDCDVLADLLARPASTSLADQKLEIETRQALLEEQLDQLKKSSKQNPPSLNSVISQLSNLKDVTDLISSLDQSGPLATATKDASAALKPVIDGLNELNQLVGAATTIWKTQASVSVNPRTLAPSKEEMQLAMLAEDVQYLKDLMLIRARRTLDDAAFLETLKDVLPQMKRRADAGALDLTADIRSDLARLAREGAAAAAAGDAQRALQLDLDIRGRLEILYAAGSVFAQNTAASNVALLRETIAWRRHQIRAHAIYNGAYEQTVQIATERLAAYYAAGFKPSQIAQLIHDLAAAVSLPKIAF